MVRRVNEKKILAFCTLLHEQQSKYQHNQQRTSNLPWLSDADIHDQVLLVALLVGDLQADSLPDVGHI